jgi:phosphate transport system protein
MVTHLHRDMAALRQEILTMGGLVEAALRDGTEALVKRQSDLARRVIAADSEIDRMEKEVDEECLKILALHHPVAGDLRFITAVMKINNDLERIADLAANVGERALDLMQLPTLDESLQFESMTETARDMLRTALDALVERDSGAALGVLQRDDLVDDINRRHFEVLERRMQDDPEAVRAGLLLLSASRNLERVADLATNIAEDVIFLVEAQDIRHTPGRRFRESPRQP